MCPEAGRANTEWRSRRTWPVTPRGMKGRSPRLTGLREIVTAAGSVRSPPVFTIPWPQDWRGTRKRRFWKVQTGEEPPLPPIQPYLRTTILSANTNDKECLASGQLTSIYSTRRSLTAWIQRLCRERVGFALSHLSCGKKLSGSTCVCCKYVRYSSTSGWYR